MANSLKKIFPYFLIIILIVFPLFLHSGYLFFTDFVWGPKVLIEWQSNSFFINFFIKTLSYILLVSFLQKIYLSVVLLSILSGAKKLIQEIYFLFVNDNGHSNYWLIFILSLFALFNPFIYDRVMYGQIGVVVAFGFMILAFGFLLEFFRNEKTLSVVWFGICVGIMNVFSTHFVFIALPLIVVAAFLIKDYKMDCLIILRGFLIATTIVLIINANWLVSYIFLNSKIYTTITQSITKQDLIAFQTTGKNNAEVVSNVFMMSGFWGKDQHRYIDLTQNKNWGKSFFILLPIIIWGLMVSLRDKKQRFFSIGLIAAFVVATVLAVGIRVPVAREITYWLFDHVPFYKGLREPQKWVAVLVVIYLIYLSLGVRDLLSKKFVFENRVMLGILLAGVIVMQAPLLLFGFGGQVKPVNYPSDWQTVDQYIKQDSGCRKKILFLPWHMYMNFGWIGNVVANPAPNYFSCSVISGTDMEWGGIYDNSGDPNGAKVAAWINEKGSDILFNDKDLNLGYIIVAKEVDWRNFEWLNGMKNLELVQDSQTLRVYKINP